jgi:hypothetical protein
MHHKIFMKKKVVAAVVVGASRGETKTKGVTSAEMNEAKEKRGEKNK